MRRAIVFAGLTLLAGCDDPASQRPSSGGQEVLAECNVGGGWTGDCVIERADDILIIRHPDGGFRRFRVLADGRGLEPADGAEEAKIAIIDAGRIEIETGGQRYRLPARIAASGQ